MALFKILTQYCVCAGIYCSSLVQQAEVSRRNELHSPDHKRVVDVVSGGCVRSIGCEFLLAKSEHAPICSGCGGKFKTNMKARDAYLKDRMARPADPSKVQVDSRTPVCILTSPEKREHLRNPSSTVHALQKKVKRLNNKISRRVRRSMWF